MSNNDNSKKTTQSEPLNTVKDQDTVNVHINNSEQFNIVPPVQDKTPEQPVQNSSLDSSEADSDDLSPKEDVKPKRRKKGYSKNGKKLGRPSNKALAKAKKNPVGRPRGDNAAIQEYKARMLASPKSAKVLEAVMEAASDPDHKNFTAAAKLVLDRILPVSAFEEIKKGGNRAGINITITGVDGTKTVIGEDIDDADYTEIDDNE